MQASCAGHLVGAIWRRVGLGVVLAGIAMGVASSGAGAAEVCPNEALRQELRSGALPDCRAYEMVTPVYNGGASSYSFVTQLGVLSFVLSGDGSRVLVQAPGGSFAETKSEYFENTMYELSRTGSGWAASALSPAASLAPEPRFLSASTDLTRTLWDMRSPSESIYEEDMYVREPGGQFVKVGPLVPPSFGGGPRSGTTPLALSGAGALFQKGGGASADLSHIVVPIVAASSTLVGDRWPGDTTLAGPQLNSLYEYSGVGLTRPELVGVNNEGGQITQCGTTLGGLGEKSDKYNAVSASGEAVFFTAKERGCKGLSTTGKKVEASESKGPEVAELYARVGGKEVVKISEPLESQCQVCRTGTATKKEPAVTERPAEFLGASEDGSKAFFTTKQELLAGQTTNNLYEYDFGNPHPSGGIPTGRIVLVSAGSGTPEVQGVARVSEDGSHVYFVAKGILTSEPDRSLPAGHQVAQAGADNLYVFERDGAYPAGHIAFVADLCSASGESGSVVDLSCNGNDEEDWSASDARPVQTTPDGRFAVFTSTGDLTAGDTGTVRQAFEYDAQEEELVRISIGQNGFNNNGNTTNETEQASIVSPEYSRVDSAAEAESSLAISNDGSYVFFRSADELTEGAKAASAAGAQSVYEYHSTGSIANGNVYLVSDGSDTSKFNSPPELGTELLGADASGGDVFFQTGDPVLALDTNGTRDVYDARIDGGFAEPAAPVECSGDACQGALASSSLFRAPGSASAAAGGNLPPPPQAKPPAPTESKQAPAKPSTRARKLGSALKACRKMSDRRKRKACEAQAKRKYGTKSGAKSGRGK